MEKRSSRTASSQSDQIRHFGLPLNAEGALGTAMQSHTAIESIDSSTYMPIVVLVPNNVGFGGLMGQLSRAEGWDWSAYAASKVVPIPVNCIGTSAESVALSRERKILSFGEVTIDVAAMEVRRNGKPVLMPLKEFSMLSYMLANPGRVIGRDELLNEVWGYENYPCTRTVDNHVLRLRRKLEPEPSRPKHFLTIHSAGYKFMP
jgi:transcriptional regulator